MTEQKPGGKNVGLNALLAPAPYYQDADVTIYHGQTEQLLPVLGMFDLLLTDPPYGIDADRDRKSQKNGWVDYGSSGWDKQRPPEWMLQMCIAAAKKAVVWGGNYFDLPPRMGWLVWDKGQRDFSLADCELAWTTENKAVRAFDYSRAMAMKDGKQHATQKPVQLMQWCIAQMGDLETIVDPFAGSGTTGVAAKNMNKKCVLIEAEERYCEIAARRLGQETLFRANAQAQPRSCPEENLE